MAAAPKFDFKMLVVPAILFFAKKIDFKDPAVLELVRNCFIGGTTYLYILGLITHIAHNFNIYEHNSGHGGPQSVLLPLHQGEQQ